MDWTTNDFGDLRSALHEPPSGGAWERVCALMERWSAAGGEDERSFEYALGHLGRWSPELRAAPPAWIERLMRGQRVPELALAGCVDLTGRHPIEDVGVEALCEAPDVAGVRSMKLPRQKIGARGARAIARSPELARLERLDLSANELGVSGARALGFAERLDALTHLNVHHNQLDSAGTTALLASPLIERLIGLVLSGNPLSPGGLDALRRQGEPLVLEELSLNTCGLRWPDAKSLGDSAHMLPRLKVLHLNHNALTHDTIAALFRFVPWDNLEELSLNANWLGAMGVRVLANTRSLDALERLSLGNNSLGVAGATALGELALVAPLESLALPANDLGDDGVRVLGDMPGAERLQVLDLSRNALTPRGVSHLVHSPWRAGLRELNLQHNKFGDEGLERLLDEPWPNLRRLGLRFVGLTDASAKVLAERADRLPALESLELDFNDISEQGDARISEAGLPWTSRT